MVHHILEDSYCSTEKGKEEVINFSRDTDNSINKKYSKIRYNLKIRRVTPIGNCLNKISNLFTLFIILYSPFQILVKGEPYAILSINIPSKDEIKIFDENLISKPYRMKLNNKNYCNNYYYYYYYCDYYNFINVIQLSTYS